MFDFKNLTHEKAKQCQRIAEKTNGVLHLCGVEKADETAIAMDIAAVFLVDNINLDKLESFDAFNLLHDINGIRKNLDRETGILKGNFLPRCAH